MDLPVIFVLAPKVQKTAKDNKSWRHVLQEITTHAIHPSQELNLMTWNAKCSPKTAQANL